MHVIKDSERRTGYWFDMDFSGENWRHFYSLYRFEPNLRWSTIRLPDDRQGAYWQAESGGSDLTFSTGLELEQSNINRESTRDGHIRMRGYKQSHPRLERYPDGKGTLAHRRPTPFFRITWNESSQRFSGNVPGEAERLRPLQD